MLLTFLLAADVAAASFDIVEKVVPGLLIALIMMGVNMWRDNGRRHEDRIKHLEAQNALIETRMAAFQLEREALVDKYNLRFVAVENKLTYVDKLSAEVEALKQNVGILTEKINQTGRTLDKVDNKIDKLFERLDKK